MALGPGALALLTQPTHVRNPASGTGLLRGAALRDQREQQKWYQGQREKEFEAQTRRADEQMDFRREQFEYEQAEAQRKLKAQAYDELMEAIASNNPDSINIAVQKARRYGIDVPGYQVAPVEPPKPAETQPEGESRPMTGEEQKLDQELDQVQADALRSIRGEVPPGQPQVGESIGDGWEVVETPPEAAAAPEAPDLPPAWLRNEMMQRGDISLGRAEGREGPLAELPAVPPTQAPQQPPLGHLAPPPVEQAQPGAQSRLGMLPPMTEPQGYQIVDTDTGQVVGSFDTEAALRRVRTRIDEAFRPLIENQRDTDGQRAAAIAKDTATRLVGMQGFSVSEAVEEGMKRYDKEMGRSTAKSVARGGRPDPGDVAGGFYGPSQVGSSGLTGKELKDEIALGNYVNLRYINRAQQMFGTQDFIRIARTAQTIASKMADTNPVAQRGAIRDVVVMTEGKRSTDRDLAFALQGGGALAQLHMELLSWVGGGSVPANLREKFGAYANMLEGINHQKRAEAMEWVREQIMGDPVLRQISPEAQQYWVDQAMRGVSGIPIKAKPRRDNPTQRTDKTMRDSGLDEEADALAEELGGAG